MATSAGEIEVVLSLMSKDFKEGLARIEQQLKGTESGVKKFGTTLAGIFSAKQIFDFGKAAFQAFGEQEAAVVKLNQALANFGQYSQKTSQDLQDYATALQQTTVYADEQVTAVQAQLVAFGLQGKQLKDVTKSTLDLASAKGIDLSAAAQLLGKAFVGETGALSRYGIVIDDNIPKSEKFAATLGKVNSMFGGQAEKERQTALGQLKGMQNTYGELMETIGALVAGPATALMSWLGDVINKVNAAMQMISAAKNAAGGFANFVSQTFVLAITAIVQTLVEAERWVANAFLKYLTMIPGFSAALKLIGVDIDSIILKVNAGFTSADQWIGDQGIKLQTLANKWLGTGQAAVASEEMKKQATIEYHNVATEAAKVRMVTEEELRKAQLEGYLANIEVQRKALEEFLGVTDVTWSSTFKRMGTIIQSTFDAFGKAMADVIVDSRNFSEALKSVWKGLVKALISEIIALIAKLIIALALKSALGLGGSSVGTAAANIVALKGLAGAGKAAKGAIIGEPSLVTGLKSGKTILAGEAGAEAIVPMGGSASGNKTASEMGMDFSGAMGGGGVNLTVNISGQFIEANETVWQKMFRDKILPEIRRATMSNPTGNFIRRRGATA